MKEIPGVLPLLRQVSQLKMQYETERYSSEKIAHYVQVLGVHLFHLSGLYCNTGGKSADGGG